MENDPKAAILALRCLQRLRRTGESLQFVGKFGAEITKSATNAERAIFAAIAGRITELGDNPAGAEYWQTTARGYALLCEDRDVLAEVAYYLATSAWSNRDIATTASQLEIVDGAKSPRLRALSNDVRALMYLSEGRYADALASYETALLLLSTSEESADHWAEGNALRQMSGLAADLGRAAVTEIVAERYESFKWSEDQRHIQFGCAFNTGLALDSMGYQVRAFKYFRDAAELAPDIPSQLWVYAVRSRAAQITGERLFSDDQLSSALRLYGECDWGSVNAEGRLSLLDLAIALRYADPNSAASVIERYKSIRPVRSFGLVSVSDFRLTAREQFSEAVVALALGDQQRGIRLLSDAFEIFDRFQQVQSASECAIELGAIGIRSERLDGALERAAAIYENSWNGRRARALLQSEMVVLST